MDHPVLPPDLRIDLIVQAGRFQGSRNLAQNRIDNARTGRKKSMREASHCEPSSLSAAAGHDVMHVRMILQRAAPGVQHAEEAATRRAQMLGIGRQLLDGFAGRLEQRGVARPADGCARSPAAPPAA